MINGDWKQPKYGDFIGFIPIWPVNLLFLPVPYTIYHLIRIKQKPPKNRKVVDVWRDQQTAF